MSTHRQHELRVGMSLFWIQTWSEARDGCEGHRWSGSGGKLTGWVAGDRAAALVDARKAYMSRAFMRVEVAS